MELVICLEAVFIVLLLAVLVTITRCAVYFKRRWFETTKDLEATAEWLKCTKETAAEKQIELEDLLSSAKAISDRHGANTAWERFSARLARAGISGVTAKVFKVLPSDLEDRVAFVQSLDSAKYQSHGLPPEDPAMSDELPRGFDK